MGSETIDQRITAIYNQKAVSLPCAKSFLVSYFQHFKFKSKFLSYIIHLDCFQSSNWVSLSKGTVYSNKLCSASCIVHHKSMK